MYNDSYHSVFAPRWRNSHGRGNMKDKLGKSAVIASMISLVVLTGVCLWQWTVMTNFDDRFDWVFLAAISAFGAVYSGAILWRAPRKPA